MIDSGGRYTPRHVGTWEVRAAVSSVYGTAQVTVTPGALAAIDVTPSPVTVRADRTQQFTATGRDANGNAVVLSAPVWTVDDGSISAGLFDPHHVGAVTVTARESGISGMAAAAVVPGAVARVQITPPAARVAEGGFVSFLAVAYDAKDNVVPTAVFAWRVEGGIGTVDGSGAFVGGHAGSGRVVVTATDDEGSASANAGVVVEGGAGLIAWIFLLALLLPVLFLVLWRRRRKASSPPVA